MCRHAGVSMETVLKEVHISTEPDLGGASLGTLYTDGEHEVIELTDDDRRKYGDDKLKRLLFSEQDFRF